MNFLSVYLKCCVKKVCRLHCRCIYGNVPDCKHGESVTFRGVGISQIQHGSFSTKPREGISAQQHYESSLGPGSAVGEKDQKRDSNRKNIGEQSELSGGPVPSPDGPLGSRRSPIFFFCPRRFIFLFLPMRNLVPVYYERGTNHT